VPGPTDIENLNPKHEKPAGFELSNVADMRQEKPSGFEVSSSKGARLEKNEVLRSGDQEKISQAGLTGEKPVIIS